MSAITVGGSIPPGINTLERLVAWGLLSHNFYNGGFDVRFESEPQGRSVGEAAIIADVNGDPYLVGRVAIKLASNYATDSAKLWQSAQEYGNFTIGTAYTSN